MAGMSLTINDSQLKARLARMRSSSTLEKVGVALYSFGEIIMTASKQECPVDTGTLRASGHVDQPKISGSSIVVRLGYGGAASGYAIFVHEGHRTNGGGTSVAPRKFLEGPMLNHAGQFGSFLGPKLGTALKSAWGK